MCLGLLICRSIQLGRIDGSERRKPPNPTRTVWRAPFLLLSHPTCARRSVRLAIIREIWSRKRVVATLGAAFHRAPPRDAPSRFNRAPHGTSSGEHVAVRG